MTIQMSEDVAAQVEDRFDNLSQDFFNLSDLVQSASAQLEGACGEFSGDMGAYTPTFESGWSKSFEIASDCAGLIAGNTNQLKVDLDKIDRDLEHTTEITI